MSTAAHDSASTCPSTPRSSSTLRKHFSPSSSLKRSRSPSLPSSTMELVPAPQIDGEAMLEIFVHRSIKFTGIPLNPDSPYGDGGRLAMIGEKALEAAYTLVFFNKRPILTADALESEVSKLPIQVEKWVEGYRWRDKVRHSPEIDLRAPHETLYLMNAYVGAVLVGEGFQGVLNWITALVDPSTAQQGQYSEPVSKRSRPDQHMPFVQSTPPAAPSPYSSYPPLSHMYMPPQPATPAPPLPPNPLAPAAPQSAFLPLFNQTAQQRRLEVQYPADFCGPAHAGRWTARCLVNGIEKGVGTGPSKQLAKEEAARQAYYTMGWAPRV